MHNVFQGQHLAEAHLVCNLLRAAGIVAEVQGNERYTTVGLGSSVPGMLPTVWIPNHFDSERAQELIARFTKGELNQACGSSWECPECHEIHENQFMSCWKCGVPKPAQEPA
jgi:hypothetical protein